MKSSPDNKNVQSPTTGGTWTKTHKISEQIREIIPYFTHHSEVM